jgi:lipopolysaccharide biosynthesis regulator YciM
VPYLEWLVNYLEGKRRLKELPPYAHELGHILESMGQEEKAIQYYRLAHEHDAGNVTNALALGRLYLARGENEKALRMYQPLILRMDGLAGPARIEILLSLARVNYAQGDKKKARQFVLRVLQEEPENAEAQSLLQKGL